MNKLPMHHDTTHRERLIEKLIEISKIWDVGTVPVTPNDVEMLVCPRGRRDALRRALPKGFEDVPIYSYAVGASLRTWVGIASQWMLELRRRRDRIVYIPYEAPKGSILLPMAADGTAIALPEVGRLNGLLFYRNAVKNRAFVSLQYQDEDDRWLSLGMPIPEALHLMELLSEMSNDERFRGFNE